ncbi:Mitogen-activated protein kinase kinase kinase 3 [Glycine max]|nr:Mitogen-activated protein kinase kinase kinase 3 [Glycine max]
MIFLKQINSSSSMLSFKGSPYWMAPEVVMNTNGNSLPVDIWSLGCTILEMETSKPPWNQYEGVAAIFKIGNSRDMPKIPEICLGSWVLELSSERPQNLLPQIATHTPHCFSLPHTPPYRCQ